MVSLVCIEKKQNIKFPEVYTKLYQSNFKGISKMKIQIDEDSINIRKFLNANEINDVLDEANYIKEQYFLEVSSPGIERILRKDSHLEQNIGNQVEVKLFKKDENGNKNYIGELKEFDEDTITVEAIEEVKIERKNIAQIKTIYDWDNDVNDEN